MRARIVLGVAAVIAGLAVTSLARAAGTTYTIDSVHSMAIFKIRHLGVSNTYGRINGPTGTVVFDEQEPEKSSIAVELKAENVDTGVEKRDQHLKSPDFFNAKQFPTITFKSKSVKKTSEHAYEATGDFTLHGVTKEITVPVTHVGSGKGMKGEQLCGFETRFTIKRSDHDMKFMVGPVGDEVEITLSIEASRS